MTSNRIRNTIAAVIAALVMWGCAADNTGVSGQLYHNTTARYNAYFYAREILKEAKAEIEKAQEDHYEGTLPLLRSVDSTHTFSQKEKLEEVIKKASIAIQRHPSSQWTDDCYVLVGQARLYLNEFDNAVETFKFVNTKSEDDDTRHQALIHLIRTFVENKMPDNAVSVEDFILKEKLSKENAKRFGVARASLYQHLGEDKKVVEYLAEVAPQLTRREERARTFFILGQHFQKLGKGPEAYESYRRCLRSNPSYELDFHARLNMAQVTTLGDAGSLKKARKYFNKLLRDKKNEDFQDKIFYEIGQFEARQDNIDGAVDAYRKSISKSKGNVRQKAYSYLRLGEIHYEKFRDFKSAKNYYDSALTSLPKTDPDYLRISKRQKVLDKFAKAYYTIVEQDSLLRLSSRDSSSVMAELMARIKARKDAEKKAARQAAKRLRRQPGRAFQTGAGQAYNFGATESPTGEWYFHDPATVSAGRAQFRQVWGQLELRDNWNRASAERTQDEGGDNPDDGLAIAGENTPGGKARRKPEAELIQEEASVAFAKIPFSASAKAEASKKIENAYYDLGKIYRFDLSDTTEAVKTFDTMLERFPETEYEPEVLYSLYLMLKPTDAARAEVVKNILLSEFPDTIYAKLLINPNYSEEKNARTLAMLKKYDEAYTFFKADSLVIATNLADDALRVYGDIPESDRFRILKILVRGKTDGYYPYKADLNTFLKDRPESPFKAYAEKLLKAADAYKAEVDRQKSIHFIPDFKTPHSFVVIYPNEKEYAESVPKAVEAFMALYNQSGKLASAQLALDKRRMMAVVEVFADKTAAMRFYGAFNGENGPFKALKANEIHNFVINKDNMHILTRSKAVTDYMRFFEANYLLGAPEGL
ncbi:hypothetical protein FUAX_08450 [Fulvitalea axinellae]|uniref:Tetratricopeptide repeat protein n=1 Tax=Fulvitalea axinellae TaxID=1182444 RepID=A0AAU9CEW1_9BACT|nr:hypothetical protein FUAX_08450 [Fulvitalea axinellae]